jgi:hypothetical protein
MTKKLLALLAALCLFMAASCGDDGGSEDADTDDTEQEESDSASEPAEDDDEAEEVAFDEWLDDANQVCEDFVEAADDIGSEAEALETDDLEGQSEVFADLASLAEDELIQPLTDLGTPDENADEVEEYIDLVQEQADLINELSDAAADEDEDAMEELLDEGETQSEEVDDLATEIGLDECVEDDEATDDTTDTTTDDTEDDDGGLGSTGDSEGMAGDGVIDGALLEADIESEYLAQLGLTIDVTCPVDQPLVAGDVFECEGIDEEGDTITFEVTQRDELGNVTYESVAVNGQSI